MEVEDFYTGEKKDIVIPEGCIMIDEEKLSFGYYALIDDDEDIDGFNAKIVVDFFPNNPKRFSDLPLYKSSKEGQFKVIVIKDKYYKWVDLKRRQKQNDIKRQQNIEKQQAIYDKISHLRFEGDIYRKESQFESAITSYNLSLQVDYKIVNKWFKTDCIGQNLLSYNGLIIIYHKLNAFEKEQEYLERAISLASLDSRFKKEISKYKHRLEKLLGTYKEKEIPPESHMNVVYTDLTNYIEVLDKMYHPIIIKNGCVVTDKKEAEINRKIWGYFNSLLKKGKDADNEFDYKTAADMYERLLAEGYYTFSFPYDRLITLYFNYKLYEDEVRVITSAINTFTQRNGEFHKGTGYKNEAFHFYDKQIARWEKRLVAAKKRLQSYQKRQK
jgi:tetratricopeptide (TPR) repeat protein